MFTPKFSLFFKPQHFCTYSTSYHKHQHLNRWEGNYKHPRGSGSFLCANDRVLILRRLKLLMQFVTKEYNSYPVQQERSWRIWVHQQSEVKQVNALKWCQRPGFCREGSSTSIRWMVWINKLVTKWVRKWNFADGETNIFSAADMWKNRWSY